MYSASHTSKAVLILSFTREQSVEEVISHRARHKLDADHSAIQVGRI